MIIRNNRVITPTNERQVEAENLDIEIGNLESAADNLDTEIDKLPIAPTGTIEITENGTVDVTNYATANVNVSGGGGNTPIEISTEEEMNAVLTEENVGKVYKYIGTSGTYIQNDIYIVTQEANE